MTAAVTDLFILAGNAAKHCQGKGNQCPDDKDDADGSKRQRSCGVIGDGDCVKEREADEHWTTEESHREQHIAYLHTQTA